MYRFYFENILVHNATGNKLEKSLFYNRILLEKEWKKAEGIDNAFENDLINIIIKITGNAKKISNYILAFFPHFTLHDETHFYNVLAIMEFLAAREDPADTKKATVNHLTPAECAFALLSAFIHDLGMLLPRKEMEEIEKEGSEAKKAFEAYCLKKSEYRDIVKDIEGTFDGDEKTWRTGIIKEKLLHDYIRETHGSEKGGYDRIYTILSEIEKEPFGVNLPENFKKNLCRLGMSHGEAMDWFVTAMGDEESAFKDHYKGQPLFPVVSTRAPSLVGIYIADLQCELRVCNYQYAIEVVPCHPFEYKGMARLSNNIQRPYMVCRGRVERQLHHIWCFDLAISQ